jgi:hypothetical protein
MRPIGHLFAIAALLQACTPEQAFSPPRQIEHTTDDLREIWSKCVLSHAEQFSRSSDEVGRVAERAFDACRSDENALIASYSASSRRMLRDDDLRRITRGTLYRSIVPIVDNAAKKP